jgi:hypothetical protein
MSASSEVRADGAVIAASLSIFTSSATLICCALPALFVALGAGAALVGIVTAVPGLIWMSTHKVVVFVLAGSMLFVAGAIGLRSRRLPCPVDPDLRQACRRIRRVGTSIYLLSVVLFGIGAVFAFAYPLLA